MSADALAAAIYALGVTNNTFNTALGGTALIAGRFYPEGFKSDEVPTKPYVTYRIITMAENDQFRVTIDKALVQIKCCSASESPADADGIVAKAKTLFHKKALTVTGCKGAKLFRANVVPAYREGDYWTSVIDFRTLIQEN